MFDNRFASRALLPLLLCCACANPPDEPADPLEGFEIPLLPIDRDLVSQTAEDQYATKCLRQVYYHCPDLSAVWRAKALVDVCQDTVLTIEDCEEVLECIPQDGVVHTQPCTSDRGTKGMQGVFCSKGHWTYGPCMPCELEERCDRIDNDCNGETDEGRFPCSNDCGHGQALCVDGELTACDAPTPQEEICNYQDDDCDGETDEYQRNACDLCGPAPDEICDGIDNDCDGDLDEGLFQPCSSECGGGIDTCVAGSWHCSAPPPIPEQCNGMDDDCDGYVDEGLACGCTAEMIGGLFPCAGPPLVCGQGFSRCVCADEDCTATKMTDCQALCAYAAVGPSCDPTLGEPVPELCNAFDDDCDELVDEDLVKACYTGPPGTEGVGICHSGTTVCLTGAWGSYVDELFVPGMCEDERLPEATDPCNGTDDDCDGVADSGKELEPTDIVFVVDWSGSMTSEISAVLKALSIFAANYSDETVIQWALVLVGMPSPIDGRDRLEIAAQPVDFPTFYGVLEGLDLASASGADEMTLDALYLLGANLCAEGTLPMPVEETVWGAQVGPSKPPLQQFAISWREDAQHVAVLFTDEPGQSYLDPSVDGADVAIAINQGDLAVYGFTPSSLETWWSPVLSEGWFKLTASADSMLDSLLQILDETACSSGQASDP